MAPPKPAPRTFRPDEEVWHLTLDQIESHTGIIIAKRIAPAGRASSSTFTFDPDNVLYSKLRPYLGKVVRPQEPGIATSELIPLRPHRDVLDPDFLSHYLRSKKFLNFASQYATGAKMPRVMMASFWGHEIPLPLLDEQRRVVEILGEADRVRKLRARADERRQGILSAMFDNFFGSPSAYPPRWPLIQLGNATEHLTSGSRGWSEFTGRGRSGFLRTQDIDNGEISPELMPVDPPAGTEAERTRLVDGDVVVTITGMVGKAAVFEERPQAVYVSQHVALVRLDRNQLLPHYLVAYANFPSGSIPTLARHQYGQIKPGLGFRELKQAMVPMPPIELQTAFVERVYALRALSRKCTQAKQVLDQLWDEIVRRAFTGDLTFSWRQAHMKELLQEMEQQAKALAAYERNAHIPELNEVSQ